MQQRLGSIVSDSNIFSMHLNYIQHTEVLADAVAF